MNWLNDDRDRTLDALLATHLFGWSCVHDFQPVTRAMIVADARAAFTARYGQSPPPAWEPDTPSQDCYCTRDRLVTSRFDGSWCPKCLLRREDIPRDEQSGLHYWAENLGYGWRVVDKMRERGFLNWLPGLEGLTEAQAATAIARAALDALGIPVAASATE